MTCIPGGSPWQTPTPDAAGTLDAEAAPGTVDTDTDTAALDAQAIARLRELDPSGSRGIVARVLRTYEDTLLRQLDDFNAAALAADVERIARLAHTLKSSSASIGALKLSQLCAELEHAVRSAQPSFAAQAAASGSAVLTPAAASQLDALLHEAQRVRRAVRAMLVA